MLVPLSWLKEYVPIKMPLPKLLDRLTEAGVGVENVAKKEEETIIEFEITPNRPDLLSIVGIAREAAAIQKTSVKLPKATIPKAKKRLPINIRIDFTLSPRVSAVIIDNVKVKESPLWLSERLTAVNQRPINNIVDITNFVMFELGNPLHAFDYDQIKGHTMSVTAALGGESFTSVDKLTYKLPKGANIIKDTERIIDLCGIKGGLNSAITEKTKRVLLWSAVDDGPNIRRTSQMLSLRSEASSIYERGVNRGGTLYALARATSFIRDLGKGTIASEVMDFKKSQFNPWQVTLSMAHLHKLLGIKIEKAKVLKILTLLNLHPVILGTTKGRTPESKGDSGQARMTTIIKCTIPTYRNDLQIEEDIIEEVARLYGYNKFPKTLPSGEVPRVEIPYASDFERELSIKQILTGFGLSEANTYSLIGKDDLSIIDTQEEKIIHVANPVSREFSLLRPSLLVNLLKSIPENAKYTDKTFGLFELGKVYVKQDKEALEKRSLAGVLYPSDYFDIKGILEAFFEKLSVQASFVPQDTALPFRKKRTSKILLGKEEIGTVGEISVTVAKQLSIDKTATCFEIDFETFIGLIPTTKTFNPIPKFPPVIEDLSIVANKEVLTADLIEEMKKASPLLVRVDFLDSYEDTRTFRLTFQDPTKNLTSPEVSLIRGRILRHLKTKFSAELKS